jgi:hypothetical protein
MFAHLSKAEVRLTSASCQERPFRAGREAEQRACVKRSFVRPGENRPAPDELVAASSSGREGSNMMGRSVHR